MTAPATVPHRRGALTLVEALVSILVVSGMLVAALNSVGAAKRSELLLVERERALALARGLMAEILQQAYADPDNGPGSFGIGAGESTGTRSLFDDVDDYDGWTASPPQNKDGSVIPGCTGYEQRVAVAWVSPTQLTTPSVNNTGMKRIEVTIRRNGKPIITLTAFRSQTWASPAGFAAGVWP